MKSHWALEQKIENQKRANLEQQKVLLKAFLQKQVNEKKAKQAYEQSKARETELKVNLEA